MTLHVLFTVIHYVAIPVQILAQKVISTVSNNLIAINNLSRFSMNKEFRVICKHKKESSHILSFVQF